MKKLVNAMGMPCPQPVILAKKALSEFSEVVIKVDNDAAKQNVSRFGQANGCDISCAEILGGWELTLLKKSKGISEIKDSEKGSEQALSILIKSEWFGTGDQSLGEILMKSYLYALTEVEIEIKYLIFMNSGINLTCNGSQVLDSLKALIEQGAEIFSCGTCLKFYNKEEQLAIGKVTNMYSAIEMLAEKNCKNITI
ncbi:MAG: sulfurtransferase-like selenium metabolism protein YedF [Clostridia bacterium]